jgi:hypothetical protein
VDRGQAQSATTTGEHQTAVNTLIDTFMKQLRQEQEGIIIAASGGIRSQFVNGNGGKEGMREIASRKRNTIQYDT